MKKIKNIKQIGIWVLAFFFFLVIYQSLRTAGVERSIPYSEFKQKVRAGAVVKVKMRHDLIRGEMREGEKIVRFRTVPLADPKLIEELEGMRVGYTGEADRSWVTAIIINVGWIVLFFFLWWFLFMRQAQMGGKQALSFGRSKAKQQDLKKMKITFADVAGCDESKEELQDIVDYLKNPKKYQELGGELPKGILLYGAPGTGKTLLARAVAGEGGVPFFTSSGSEFVEMFVGVGASRVRDLFEQAKKNTPAIIFLDELDAVGRHRFAGIGGGHDEREQTLNQLLVELDGFDTKQNIVLIGATNRPDVLDPALLRPGRFDRHINIPTPDLKGRTEILKIHAKKIKLSSKADLSVIARRTPGFVGADLASIINEAAILGARRSKSFVEMSELEESIERIMVGPQRKSRVISDREKKIIAYHESGHTLVAKFLPNCDPVHKVSIIPRGPALGYTLQLPLEDKYLTTATEMRNKLAVLLGGRTAEEIVFKDITTGALDDLIKVTSYAQKMVTEFGMSERIGPISLRKDENEIFLGRDIARQPVYSEDTARTIDEEIRRIVTESCAKAREIIKSNRAALDKLAARLIEKEVVEGSEIDAILGTGGVPA